MFQDSEISEVEKNDMNWNKSYEWNQDMNATHMQKFNGVKITMGRKKWIIRPKKINK